MAATDEQRFTLPPVQLHFKNEFPVETRGVTSENEPVIIEITKVEYSLEENGDNFDVTFYFSGIKSFSITDDDQECFISWALYGRGSDVPVNSGKVSSGNLEMGERFSDMECQALNIPAGAYDFEIIYV